MTKCECPIAGFCKRHQLRKPTHWHRLCRTKPSYFDAWEKGHGPGQKPLVQPPSSASKLQRRARIIQAVAQKQRLISWLRFFRLPTDAGAGDTAHRLNIRASKSPDAHAALSRLLKQCGCKRQDAVSKLNQQYPY